MSRITSPARSWPAARTAEKLQGLRRWLTSRPKRTRDGPRSRPPKRAAADSNRGVLEYPVEPEHRQQCGHHRDRRCGAGEERGDLHLLLLEEELRVQVLVDFLQVGC